MQTLSYTLSPFDLKRHLFRLSLTFTQKTAATLTLSLPNWTPGSYMIREFARHIVHLEVCCENTKLPLVQIAKNRWQLQAIAGSLTITWHVYARDLSVRGAWLDTERGFVEGAAVFLRVEEKEHYLHRLSIHDLPEQWEIATTLPAANDTTCNTTCAGEQHMFAAEHYRAFIDHPIEFGRLKRLHFSAANIPHEIVLSGHFEPFDEAQLIRDVTQICTSELSFFPTPHPFSRYLFLLHVGHQIYGGLEHRSSTALLADRNALPRHDRKNSESYQELLGLISHEYFHSWNVKAIQNAAFVESYLNTEAYSAQLWAFEGITSYYDDLFLLRSGVIEQGDYLQLLTKNINRYLKAAGRRSQTLENSSFNAWSRYYKWHENSPNTDVSYYQKGALAALCLDATIREKTAGQKSLDDVMQQAYANVVAGAKPLAEGGWEQLASQVSDLDLKGFFDKTLRSTDDLPLAESLAVFGVTLSFDEAKKTANFGAQCKTLEGAVELTHVAYEGSALNAGLSPGDKIIAINRHMINNFNDLWEKVKPGDALTFHFFRHGMLQVATGIAQQSEPVARLSITDETRFQAFSRKV